MLLKQFVLMSVAVTSVATTATAFGGNESIMTNKNESSKPLLDPANIDAQVKPGDNFFLYANGTWLKNNPIPSSETRWGSFNELQENNYKALHELLDAAAADQQAKKGSAAQKVGDFYKTGMNTDAINKAGIAPLQAYFKKIDALKSSKDIMNFIAKSYTEGNGQLFGFYVSPDDKNVTQNIAQFVQSGIGMPDRDYYFGTDERTVKIREAYKAYQVKMLELMGMNKATAEKEAAAIYTLEEKLAKASMTRVEMRDPYKLYNKYTLAQLNQQTPNINWNTVFTNLKIGSQNTCIVGMPKFFEEVSTQLQATPLAVWKVYLKFHTLSDAAPYLSEAIDNTHFDFYGKTVRGQQEQKPRWKRVLNVVDGSLGELLGQMYVEKNFKPEAKSRMLEMVNNLQTTYAARIIRLDWMSASTKQKALVKLNTFIKKIGYPDKWRSYDELAISNKSYYQNAEASAAFEYNYMIGKLGKPVDKAEWQMTPPTVNAYYNPAFNEIVFPAGILQYPFFDMNADDAVNYGGIGAVIGHEMTHGFDDQGRQYDADGNLKDWWTPEDAKKFEDKAGVVVKQFNSYTVLENTHVNGELTLGENLADLGGLAIAYEAFKKTKQGQSQEKIDSFTPDQRFFLSWAQVWRANTRPEEMASRIVTDPHSPNLWRCNGPLSNMEEFYQAFNVKKGDKMYKPESERAKVW